MRFRVALTVALSGIAVLWMSYAFHIVRVGDVVLPSAQPHLVAVPATTTPLPGVAVVTRKSEVKNNEVTSNPRFLFSNPKLPAVLAAPRKGKCPERYLYFANTNGRHSNQIRAVIHALHFGAYLNRTVVIPPFTQDKRKYSLEELYDTTELKKTFCYVSESEVFTTDTMHDAVCMERKGIPSKIGRQPKGGIRCVRNIKMKSREIVNVVADAAKAEGTLLYFFEVNYYRDLGPACFWRNVAPSKDLAGEVALIMASAPSIGVHLRGLENTCVGRLQKMIDKTPGLKGRTIVAADLQQCNPTAGYLKKIFAGVGLVEGPIFLADDGQRPELTKQLKQQTPRGTISYAEIPNRRYTGGLMAMLVDFWVLASVPVFVPNQASSLSYNAHNVRVVRKSDYLVETAGCYGWLELKQDYNPYDIHVCEA